MRWTTDSRALTYVDNRSGVSNIWRLPVDGSKPAPLTDFSETTDDALTSAQEATSQWHRLN